MQVNELSMQAMECCFTQPNGAMVLHTLSYWIQLWKEFAVQIGADPSDDTVDWRLVYIDSVGIFLWLGQLISFLRPQIRRVYASTSPCGRRPFCRTCICKKWTMGHGDMWEYYVQWPSQSRFYHTSLYSAWCDGAQPSHRRCTSRQTVTRSPNRLRIQLVCHSVSRHFVCLSEPVFVCSRRVNHCAPSWKCSASGTTRRGYVFCGL